MNRHGPSLRIPAVGVALVLLMGLFLSEETRGQAANKAAVADQVQKLAAAIQAGKKADAQKLAGALAKLDLDEVMKVQTLAVPPGIDKGYIIAAVAEVALAKGPPAAGKVPRKNWDELAANSRELGISLAQAQAQKKGPAAVKDVAVKISANCAACHALFK